MRLNWLLAFIPVAILLHWFGANPILVFAVSALALVPLASLTEDATDALASYVGPTWGGLLSASLGNAPEIIIGFFALRQGLVRVVKSSLAGSIVGNLLFALGVSMFAGGLKHGTQSFNRQVAGMNAGLLMLAAAGLVIPAVFHHSSAAVTREISLEISVVLFAVYLASLVYTLVTRHPALGKEAVRAQVETCTEPVGGEVGWSRNKSVAILTVVTLGLAVISEILTVAIEPASRSLGMTQVFAGVFLLALVGNVAQIFNAVSFARSNKMDLSLGGDGRLKHPGRTGGRASPGVLRRPHASADGPTLQSVRDCGHGTIGADNPPIDYRRTVELARRADARGCLLHARDRILLPTCRGGGLVLRNAWDRVQGLQSSSSASTTPPPCLTQRGVSNIGT